jgi:transglutaminase-like putative cysteine protease
MTSIYLLHQRLRYEYPAPIRNLAHRLVVIPPERHGDQRLVLQRVDVSGAEARVTSRLDRFGNRVVDVRAHHVVAAIEFDTWAVVERTAGGFGPAVPVDVLGVGRFVRPSALTRPDDMLREAAGELSTPDEPGIDLARRIAGWVFRTMRYRSDVTDVGTTAAGALALGQGVCQDYAHVMLALCRLCGLPARYVSGHLVGEGGTHAWVEVLVPGPGRSDQARVVALDPTHDRETGVNYLTIAVGRDYADVAPTSGTFVASCRGRLSAAKHLSVSDIGVALGSSRATPQATAGSPSHYPSSTETEPALDGWFQGSRRAGARPGLVVARDANMCSNLSGL